MADEPEVVWLQEHRPHHPAASVSATAQARASLVEHGRRRRARRRTVAVAAAGVLAAIGTGVAVESLAGHDVAAPPHPRVATVSRRRSSDASPAIHHTVQTPLVALAVYVEKLPAPRQHGNATLVLRTTFIDGRHIIDGAVYGGYDLYADSGRYYYAPDSLTQLQQIVNAGEYTPYASNPALDLPLLAQVAGGTPAQVRKVILRARPKPPSRDKILRQTRKLPPRLRRRVRRGELGPKHPSAHQIRAGEDSFIYDQATTLLAIGAGRPAVRAAAMKALDTLDHVVEVRTWVKGRRALRVGFPNAGYPETIWLDAATGVPIKQRDGSASATAYAVERVTTSHLPARVSKSALLR